MNEVIAVAIPTFAVILAALWNRQELNAFRSEVRGEIMVLRTETNRLAAELRGEITVLRSDLGARLDRIEADLRRFYMDLGRHEADIQNLKDRK